jgi:hypothetical protein
MAKSPRVKRQEPERTGPIRNPAVSASRERATNSNGAGGAGFNIGAAVDESLKTARRIVETSNATIQGAVERGVETAYMVIEEYMLRGQRAAGRHKDRSNGEQPMNDKPPFGGGPGPFGPFTPMMAPWVQMMRLWTDTMWAFTGQTGGADWMNQFMPGMAAWTGGANRCVVSVQVSSQQPAEVTVDLQPGADNLNLTAAPLIHSEDQDVPPLLGTAISCESGHVRVRVTVPNDQPPGSYAGALQDAAGFKRGELRVEIESAKSAKPARPRARKK